MSVDDGRGVEDSEEGVLDGKNGRGRETRARLVAGGSRSLPTMRRAATQAPAGSPAARHLRPSSASQTVISPAYLLRRTRPRDRPRCLKFVSFSFSELSPAISRPRSQRWEFPATVRYFDLVLRKFSRMHPPLATSAARGIFVRRATTLLPLKALSRYPNRDALRSYAE